MAEEAESTMSTIEAPEVTIGCIENPRTNPLTNNTTTIPCSIWKLYDNPHYSLGPSSSSSSSSSSSTQNKHRGYSYCVSTVSSRSRSSNSRSVDNALAKIKDLRSELELERRMRRKVEAANKALTKEKEAAEDRCRRLAEEVAEARSEMEAKARIVMKDKSNSNENETVVLLKGSSSSTGGGGPGLINRKKEVENPHIKRGIKGMEFPRVRGSSPSSTSRERRGGLLGSNNLECQRAQLRVLMRHKTPPSSGIIGAAQNLVM